MRDIKNHIIDLKKADMTVDGLAANKIIDIRVQPGGKDVAKDLIHFGRENGITVIIKEFGG